jgi:tetratricopeptide (TPR) repeat protein
LDSLAETQTQWHLTVAFEREAVAAVAASGNRSTEAMARYQLARMAKMANNFDEASREFTQAGKILGELPPSEATLVYALDALVNLAAIELQLGELRQAEARLAEVKPKIGKVANYEVALRFYQTQGELAWLQSHNDQAEQGFRAAVAIAEWGLKSLNDEARSFDLEPRDRGRV